MSFLKQLLTPFVEFDEDKKKEAPGTQPKVPAPPPPRPAAPPVDEPVEHPLITGSTTSAAPPVQVPTYSPSGTLVDPLPEHVQYFERLIDEANTTNPTFRGVDYKEFVDSKFDIDDITDETI